VNLTAALASFDETYSPRIVAQVNDYDVRIAHARLIHQAYLRVVALELAVDNLVDYVRRLVLARELRAIDLLLFLERPSGQILALQLCVDEGEALIEEGVEGSKNLRRRRSSLP